KKKRRVAVTNNPSLPGERRPAATGQRNGSLSIATPSRGYSGFSLNLYDKVRADLLGPPSRNFGQTSPLLVAAIALAGGDTFLCMLAPVPAQGAPHVDLTGEPTSRVTAGVSLIA